MPKDEFKRKYHGGPTTLNVIKKSMILHAYYTHVCVYIYIYIHTQTFLGGRGSRKDTGTHNEMCPFPGKVFFGKPSS